jgi:hypothetical protein
MYIWHNPGKLLKTAMLLKQATSKTKGFLELPFLYRIGCGEKILEARGR